MDKETEDGRDKGDARREETKDSILLQGGVSFLVLEEHEETDYLQRTVRYFDRVALLSASVLPAPAVAGDCGFSPCRSCHPEDPLRPPPQRAD